MIKGLSGIEVGLIEMAALTQKRVIEEEDISCIGVGLHQDQTQECSSVPNGTTLLVAETVHTSPSFSKWAYLDGRSDTSKVTEEGGAARKWAFTLAYMAKRGSCSSVSKTWYALLVWPPTSTCSEWRLHTGHANPSTGV